ncbi:MAG: YkoF family thiamine/hydroxymethylpyrimidine-binding protein [Candidatus Humimicrobiaceae bacterium]
MITMQVSLYPLGEKDIESKLNVFWDILRNENINFKVTALSTITWSDDEDKLYNVVFKAYRKVRETSNAVMVTTITTGTDQEIKQLLNFLK